MTNVDTQTKQSAYARVRHRLLHDKKKVNTDVIDGQSIYRDFYDLIHDYDKLVALLQAFVIVIDTHLVLVDTPDVWINPRTGKAQIRFDLQAFIAMKDRLQHGVAMVNTRPVSRETLYEHTLALTVAYQKLQSLLAKFAGMTPQFVTIPETMANE